MAADENVQQLPFEKPRRIATRIGAQRSDEHAVINLTQEHFTRKRTRFASQ